MDLGEEFVVRAKCTFPPTTLNEGKMIEMEDVVPSPQKGLRIESPSLVILREIFSETRVLLKPHASIKWVQWADVPMDKSLLGVNYCWSRMGETWLRWILGTLVPLCRRGVGGLPDDLLQPFGSTERTKPQCLYKDP